MVRHRRGSIAAVAAAVAPVASLAAPALVSPAVATTPGVGFTADALPTHQLNGIGWSVAQADGVVYVGGTFSTVRPAGAAPGTRETTARNFVALNAATGRPTGCRLSFTGSRASVRALGTSPDRRTLYAAGSFISVNGLAVRNAAAINLRTCRPIPSFRPQVSSWVHGLTVARNGTVYLAGDFRTVNRSARPHFAAVSPSGALLRWAPAADLSGYAVAVTPDGASVAIGGAFDRVNGADSRGLAIVNATTGALVRGYPRKFVPAGSAVKSLFADRSGIYTANEGTGPRVFDGRIALDLGTFRQRWRDTCLGATQDVLADGGNLYAASHTHDCSTMGGRPDGRRQHLTVEGTHNPRLKVWWPDTDDGLGEGLGPRALTIASGGGHRYLVAVGEFTTVNGRRQQGILRLPDRPDVGAPPAPPGMSGGTATGRRIQLRWLASIDRDDETLTYRVYRNGGTKPVATIRSGSDWWRRPQVSYVDTRVVPGALYTYRVTASDSSANTSSGATVGVRPRSTSSRYASTVLADRPTLYWRYDARRGDVVADESPSANAGLGRGTRALAVTPGALRRDPSTAIRFDGRTGYAYQARPAAPASTFTVETWFKTTTRRGGKIIGFGNRVALRSNVFDRHVYLRNDGRLTFGVYTTRFHTLTSRRAYNDGKWHHVVASQGPRGMELYVDGGRAAGNRLRTNLTYLGYWRVGGDNLATWPGAPASEFLAATVDETAVYRTQLSPQRVLAHYRAR